MELSVESSCQYVTWIVRDFFQLPSEIGYSLDSPEFRFAGNSYCLRLYPNQIWGYQDEVWTGLELVRLISPFPERKVSYTFGNRWRHEKGKEIDTYWTPRASNYQLFLSRSILQKHRDLVVPGGTFTALCSMRLKEQSRAGSRQSEEAKISDTIEEQEVLSGQSVFFSSRSSSFKMELSIESPCQNVMWKVPDLFQLLWKTGYSLKSPEFRFAGDRYCMRFYPKGNNSGDTVDTDLQLVRLTSTFPERIVLYKVGYRWRNTEGLLATYYYSGALIGDFGFCLSRSQLEGNTVMIEDGTFTVLCSMRLKKSY